MEKLFGTRKIFGELAPTDLVQGGLFSLGKDDALHRVDFFMPMKLESIQRTVIDTLICSNLNDGTSSTLCFGSDFEKEILLLSGDGKRQVSLKECFKPSIFEMSGSTAPAHIKAQICKTDIDYSYLVDKVKNSIPTWKEIGVLVNPTSNQIVIAYLWQASAITPGMSPTHPLGYFTSLHGVKIGKKKSSKKIYAYSWGNGHTLGPCQTTMGNAVQNHINAGFVLVDYI